MDHRISEIINEFYQGWCSDESSEYFKTKQYQHLQTRKQAAFKNRNSIKKALIDLSKRQPNYDFRIFEYLGKKGTDVCYIFEVLLTENCYFYEFNAEGDRKTLAETNGPMKTLTIFISILGPFFTYKVMDLFLDDKGDWTFQSQKEIGSEHQELWNSIQNILKQKGYELLSHDEVGQIVPDIYLETKEKGEATVFSCLFSELF